MQNKSGIMISGLDGIASFPPRQSVNQLFSEQKKTPEFQSPLLRGKINKKITSFA